MKAMEFKDQTGMDGNRPILFCRYCLEEFSANAGDYWDVDPEAELLCSTCCEPFELVTKQTRYVKVQGGAV